MQKRLVFDLIIKRIKEPRRFIQVLLASRQVGKTTLTLQVTETLDKPFHFMFADFACWKTGDFYNQVFKKAYTKFF